MSMRRCLKCGTRVNDQFGFCTKCGAEFEKDAPIICSKCGSETDGIICGYCKTPVNFNPNENIYLKIETNKARLDKKPANEKISLKTTAVIIIGYVLAILGGLFAIITSLYLVTRKNPRVRRHGAIQVSILVFYIVFFALMYFSGNLDNFTLENYTNVLNNYTSILNFYLIL